MNTGQTLSINPDYYNNKHSSLPVFPGISYDLEIKINLLIRALSIPGISPNLRDVIEIKLEKLIDEAIKPVLNEQ